jgi:holo-[acyl-carrier protein] synthase
MISGTGIDIIEVARVKAAFERFGDRFLSRILRPDEIRYCFSHREPAPFLAARFAAKEAVAKAFGTGIGRDLGWQDIEVAHKESGQPFVKLHGGGQQLLEKREGSRLQLTISHTAFYAVAMAILESPKGTQMPVGKLSI